MKIVYLSWSQTPFINFYYFSKWVSWFGVHEYMTLAYTEMMKTQFEYRYSHVAHPNYI